MESAFGVVLFVVVFLGAIAAVISFFGSSKLYGEIGRGAMSLNEDMEDSRSRATDSRSAAGVSAERDDEIRQLLAARNERRARQGKEPLDVEAELRRLTAPPAEAGLAAEIRSLVVARNERRARQGKEPLDVEAEVARRIEDLRH